MAYDVIIIGAGPAGLFAALELATTEARVLLLEKGADLDARTSRLEGWGGAGAYSDGKLTLSPDVGGQLTDYLPHEQVVALIQEVDEKYRAFGAPDRVYGADERAVAQIARRAFAAELKLLPTVIRHVGTEHLADITRRIRQALGGRIQVKLNTPVRHIRVRDRRVIGVETADGKRYDSRFVIAAPGRSNAEWLMEQAARLGLARVHNPVDVGVRVEVPASVLEPLTTEVYEPKLIYYTREFDDKIRTFCFCPYGEVVTEQADEIITVNGHSYATRTTENTNFALLVSTQFTEPFNEPIRYGKYLASLANMLSGGVIVQRLGDLEAGRRSTPARIARGLVNPTLPSAVPGDLSYILPYRYLSGIREMLHALDRLAPGVASRHTLLYGIEVKFYSSRLKLTPQLETEIEGLFAIGDGAGITRGLVQASASGLIAAREIIKRLQGGRHE